MNQLHSLRISVLTVALGVAANAGATVTWQYLDGFNNLGVPNNLVDMSAKIPPGLLTEIHARLPETKDIRKTDPTLITDDRGANINLLEDAEISVAFVHEGAGYRNAVGFFTYDPGNVPRSAGELSTKILFPNFSLPPEGGLKTGDGVNLGKFKAGTAVGFTIVSNGWKGRGVDPNHSPSAIFYSLKALNPEKPTTADPNLNAHTVLLSKPEDELLVLGFEDLNRGGGDHDFNDVLIAIKVTPFSAIDRGQVKLLSVVADTDNDGISDDLDAFPTDPARAARRFYPNATGFGSLAFEDLWPKKGDFDMNDLVMAYRVIETINARNEITDLKLIYEIRARGAGSDNGFGVHFPGLSRDLIDTAKTTLSIRDQAPVALPLEAGQRDVVFILSSNVTTLTKTGAAFPCSMFNTVMRCPRSAPVPMVAEIHFKTPLPREQVGDAPYNPFIYRTSKRGLEVHLVDHPPTDKADPKLFGTLDDRSDPAQGRYYRTADDQPWALDVPETWRHPTEWNNIAWAYPDFVTWANSRGAKAANWYIGRMTEAQIFK
ncbi:MAG: LruC domain-containing protein [Thiocapsa sp.]|uniref:LruC domain-containing protein n=1 Tax=Thiocapsa sp. TaxID=2024551 RepID=UPI001BCDF334|nr:LruC domain-containing protein [Thiocapsa sp.]QVL50933.1 MAG: LruC domain-containing protein [Thiocapsa sp.]